MTKTSSVAGYIVSQSHNGQLTSLLRLTHLAYLADWYSAIINGCQMTPVTWQFNHNLLNGNEIESAIKRSLDFSVTETMVTVGISRKTIDFIGTNAGGLLSDKEKQIIDKVISATSQMMFDDLMNFVYSTQPIAAKERYSHLNLVHTAMLLNLSEKQQGSIGA